MRRNGRYFDGVSIGGQAVALRVKTVGAVNSNTIYYLHADHLGSASVVSESDSTPVAVSNGRYLPYGEYRLTPNSSYTSQGFTGHLHNDSLGLIYMNARFYVPSIGRFASPDTIVPSTTAPQAFNRYTYVLNAPLNNTDPSGHYDIPYDTQGGTGMDASYYTPLSDVNAPSGAVLAGLSGLAPIGRVDTEIPSYLADDLAVYQPMDVVKSGGIVQSLVNLVKSVVGGVFGGVGEGIGESTAIAKPISTGNTTDDAFDMLNEAWGGNKVTGASDFQNFMENHFNFHQVRRIAFDSRLSIDPLSDFPESVPRNEAIFRLMIKTQNLHLNDGVAIYKFQGVVMEYNPNAARQSPHFFVNAIPFK